ncbi:DUF1211 domain-containing protein [Arthrobacter sp. Sa2BUA2]|uniref:DUF1211 domain-containing protein n=1 Tax=Arthrobacter pullicola TaxID=2762224 RepID=A0ABR8YLB9_9MICC|nr:TMEM175 family protein [Arthrobacter pullicola]MBD8045045.1 DUF1211 domain-containing protein [Arthrobacter pullicola]
MGNQLFDRSTVEFGRGISFFDAIYGFAITLLITNIDLPPAAAWASVEDLLNTGLLSQLFGFLLSFAGIGTGFRPLLGHLAVPVVFLASIPVTLLAGPVPGRLVWASLLVISPLAGRLSGGNRMKAA